MTGAFVSRWVIDGKTLEVKAGSRSHRPGRRAHGTTRTARMSAQRSALSPDLQAQDPTFGRFCSGTLSDPGLFYDRHSGKGYNGQIYFANEENGDDGRTFAVTTDGQATAFPRLGLFSWENTIPAEQRRRRRWSSATRTVLVTPASYGRTSGTSSRDRRTLDRAGLTNGARATSSMRRTRRSLMMPSWRSTYGKGVAGPVNLANVDWSRPAPTRTRRPRPRVSA